MLLFAKLTVYIKCSFLNRYFPNSQHKVLLARRFDLTGQIWSDRGHCTDQYLFERVFFRFYWSQCSPNRVRARLWAYGRGDVSAPTFGIHLNPISTWRGRLCPTYSGVYTKFWKPQARLGGPCKQCHGITLLQISGKFSRIIFGVFFTTKIKTGQ